MSIHQKLEGIGQKVHRLVDENRRLRSQNEKLLQEVKNIKATISQNEENVASLKVKLGKTQIALENKQANDPEESKVLRKQFDKYIEELDKCIEWLENT